MQTKKILSPEVFELPLKDILLSIGKEAFISTMKSVLGDASNESSLEEKFYSLTESSKTLIKSKKPNNDAALKNPLLEAISPEHYSKLPCLECRQQVFNNVTYYSDNPHTHEMMQKALELLSQIKMNWLIKY